MRRVGLIQSDGIGDIIIGLPIAKTFADGIAALSKMSGIDRNTVRSAYDQRAVSFVFILDADPGSIRDEFSRVTGLRLRVLKGLGQRKGDRS